MSSESQPVARRGDARRAKSYRRSTGILVIGELAVTAGVLIALFLGWKLYYNDAMFSNSQTSAANELSQEWAEEEPAEPEGTSEGDESGVAPVAKQFADGEAWANIIIPRFGADYRKPVAEGVGHNVLNTSRLGIGRYPTTNLPGELGNVVLASHRSAYGGAFHNINALVVGDHVFLETKAGWYQYTYRNTEYVRASQGEVLASVPHFVNETPTESLLTLTTCNPLYSTAERMIVYTVYDRWWPRAGGAPDEIAGTVNAAGN
ncbi:class E sortase [Glaciihabitans arcticus]|uniref:Class E sortase n=1 Tax=Glaciihabitans arcticus TaxID=2668039 RepID=A0A4Q9GTX5_9MICO|nr:class E sortase [Glaciihabitans arcticus]TBN58155.1 class E sortase [Glaciihabitans arcticus]